MDLDQLRIPRVRNSQREGSSQKRRKQKSRKGRPLVKAPSPSDANRNEPISSAPSGNGYGLDDIYADDSPRLEGRPRLSSFGENDGRDTRGQDDSDHSRFSEGEADSVKCHHEHGKTSGRGRQTNKQRQKEDKRRQRHKDALAETQQRKDAEPECIEIDHDGQEAQSHFFDGVNIDGYRNSEVGRKMNRLAEELGGDRDDDHHAVRDRGQSRPKTSRGRKQGNTALDVEGSLSTRTKSQRILNRDRGNGRGGHYGHNNQGVLPSYNANPLDIARSQQEANRSPAGRSAVEKKKGKDGAFTQKMGGVMGQLQKWGHGNMTSKRERQAEAAIKRQTSKEREDEQQSSGEKRKSHRRQGGRSKKPQLSPKGSVDNAIDVDEDASVVDQSGKDDEDIAATLKGCQEHVDEGDYGHLNASRNSTSGWEDDVETNGATSRKTDFGITKAPAAPRKAYGSRQGKGVGDLDRYLKQTKRGANSDDIVDVESSPRIPRKKAEWISNNDAHDPKKNGGWISRNDPPDPTKNGRRKKRSEKSNATLRKLKAQGNTIDHEWRHDHGGSSNERMSDQPKKKGKRQTKLLHDTSTGPRRRTRSASRAKNSGSEEIITIESSSSEDEMSVDGSFDVSGKSIVESSPKRNRSPGDRASIDAVRIAIGKKLFKKGCELSFQLGTRNPYILFSYLDSKGKRTEHSVHLNDPELEELKYYIDGDDDADEAHDIDDAMTVIAFRISPTDKNNFERYPNVYDPSESGKIEKRYIVVELRDADEFQAMLLQMREHPALEAWCGAEAKIPARDLAKYTKAFVEDNRKEKESRLSVGRRTRSGGANKEMKASENKLLLVYPFAVDESKLTEAAAGLTELGGDLLGVDGASVTASQVEAEVTDQSDTGGDVSESKGKSSRTHYITIREDDKDRLSPGQFLNDSLVDFWMRWISRGEPAQADSNVHFFTSHFMTTLKDEGPEAVASWTEKKNINVFKKKLIFVPVNADLHWSLCVVINPGLVANNFNDDISGKEEHSFILFLDSLKMHSKKLYTKHIRKWLNCEWKRLQKKKLGGTLSPFDESSKRVPLRSPKIPFQENGCDCGVFVCRYAYALYTMRHQKFTWEDVTEKPAFQSLITNGPAFQFGMSDIARIRKEMAKLIDNLSKHYLQMKEEEKAKKRAAKRAGKQGDSTETGEADMADASSGNEEAGDIPGDAPSKATAAGGAPVEEAEEATALKDADMADASSGKDADMADASPEEDARDVDVEMEDSSPGKEDAPSEASLAASSEDSGDAATGEDPGAPEGEEETAAQKEGDGDVAMSSSEDKENTENESQDLLAEESDEPEVTSQTI